MKRIAYIDGLRGIAIILVILFHAFAQRDWVKILPYKNTYANIIFKSGYLGVQLFFLISGFVILMTLERSRSFGSFAYKRWIRLFPSMLICSILIYITAQWLTYRPMGMPQVSSLAPGLLFTNPSIINTLFRTSVSALEGSFWSLYLEVIFYILFGGMFFLWGRSKAFWGIFILFLGRILFFKFNYLISEEYNFLFRIISRLFSEFSSKEFILFLAGSFAYLFYKERYHSSTEISNSLAEINNPPIGRDKKERKKERKKGRKKGKQPSLSFHFSSFFTNLCSTSFFTVSKAKALFFFFILILFYVPLVWEKAQSLLSHKILVFVGFISYPLYLLHENALISIIIQLNHIFSEIPHFALPFIAIVPIVIVAYCIAKWGETFTKKQIETFINLLKNAVK